MFKNLRKKKKGFTLIELIIVIAIIAILAAVAVPRFGAVRKNATVKADVANAKTIANATTTLIAEGKITLPTANTSYEINTDTPETATPAEEIEGYLQSIPTIKSITGNGNFTVVISSDGKVQVKSGAGEGATTFFPTNATQVD